MRESVVGLVRDGSEPHAKNVESEGINDGNVNAIVDVCSVL